MVLQLLEHHCGRCKTVSGPKACEGPSISPSHHCEGPSEPQSCLVRSSELTLNLQLLEHHCDQIPGRPNHSSKLLQLVDNATYSPHPTFEGLLHRFYRISIPNFTSSPSLPRRQLARGSIILHLSDTCHSTGGASYANATWPKFSERPNQPISANKTHLMHPNPIIITRNSH